MYQKLMINTMYCDVQLNIIRVISVNVYDVIKNFQVKHGWTSLVLEHYKDIQKILPVPSVACAFL